MIAYAAQQFAATLAGHLRAAADEKEAEEPPATYRPGRDDTRFGKLARELHAETAAFLAATAHHGDLCQSAELNERLAGRWSAWFCARSGAPTLWLARPVGGGEPLLTAPSSGELLALIDKQEAAAGGESGGL